MTVASETVSERIETVLGSASPIRVTLGFLGVTLALFLLVFAQDPLVHDAMHNGRHVAGFVCH